MKKRIFGLVKKLLGFDKTSRREEKQAPDKPGARQKTREPTGAVAPPTPEVAPAPTFALAELARPLGLRLSGDPLQVSRHASPLRAP